MRDLKDFNIKTLKESFPMSSQVELGEDFCIFNVRYDTDMEKNFSRPLRLEGNIILFCVRGSIRMSINLDEFDIVEGSLVIVTAQDIVKVERIYSQSPVSTNLRSDHKRLVFQQFIKLIHENYLKEHQVIYYADRLCISPKCLSRLCKEISGKSAPEWIDAYIMLDAKNLLKYSTMPIKEIVYRLIFSNQTVFYKFFKNHTGMPPTEYRNS